MANSTKPLLPPEYQQVEYLQSSGTQHIVTAVPILSTTETRTVGEILSGGEYTALVGGRNSNADGGRYIVYGKMYNTARSVYDGNGSTGNETYQYSLSGKISIIFNDANHGLYINGTLVHTYTGKLAETGVQNVALFGMSGYNGSTVSYKLSGRIYSVSFYNNTTLEHIGEYVPCYRKSDSKPGMYDLVTNTFFTNAGTGEFTVGNNV